MLDILATTASSVTHKDEPTDIFIEERKGLLQIAHFAVISLLQLIPTIVKLKAEISLPQIKALHSILIRTMFNAIDEFLLRIIEYEEMFDQDPIERSTLVRSILTS